MSIEPVLYPSGLDHIINTTCIATAALKIKLVDDTYVYSAAHTNNASLGATVIVTSATLSGVAVSGGWVSADDPTYSGVPDGDTIAGVIVWDSTNDKLLSYTGRLADGRVISMLSSASGIVHTLDGGRLLRIGGT